MAKKTTIRVGETDVTILRGADGQDLISLTDLARRSSDEPRFVIRNWMSTQNTITYLGEWESLHNPDFNRAGFRTFRDEFFEKPFSLTSEPFSVGINEKKRVGLLPVRPVSDFPKTDLLRIERVIRFEVAVGKTGPGRHGWLHHR